LQGRVVIPGFNDAHIHFGVDPKGFNLQFKTMEPSWEETRAAIEAAMKEARAGTWIFGFVGANVVLNEQVTRFALDRVGPNHPVFLRSFYGHGYIVNSKAMPLLQIAEEEPDPAGGHFERVLGSKKINGRLWEYAEWRPNRILSEMVSDQEAVKQLRQMADEAVRYGVTSLQMFSTLPVERFARLLIKADLPVRVHARPFALTSPKGRDLNEFRQLAKLAFPNPMVSASGMKWVLDGTPYEHGAALRRSYNDKPDQRGKLNFSESEIALIVKESLDFKQPLLAHCAGDKCAETVFNALESYGAKVDWKSKRVRIEHGDGVINDLIPRARKLGVVVE
jgi:predicted amidohydrolase YtcJ